MADFDFEKSSTSPKSKIPTWLDPVFKKQVKKASTEQSDSIDFDKLSEDQIKDIIMGSDLLFNIQKEAEKKEEVYAPRMDSLVRPHSKKAQDELDSKYAAHMGSDSPEDIMKAQGDVVNDGDKVRQAEEKKFESEASATEKQLDKEHSTERNSIFEAPRIEASAKGKVKIASKIVIAEEDKEAGKMPAAAMEALKKYQKGGKKKDDKDEDDKDDKKEDKKKDKDEDEDEKDDKKDDEKDEKDDKDEKKELEKDESVDPEASINRIARRAWDRRQTLLKIAGKKDVVDFSEDYYSELIGEKKNIGNVREAEIEAELAKEAAANVGLNFSDDPKADGSLDDFKMKDYFNQSADDTLKDIESEKYDDAQYGSELSDVRASDRRTKKQAHYNNRTWDMEDDGPTAPNPSDNVDPRDKSEADWWKSQVAKSEKFIDKEYKILGDGKKETHMDAIPVFKSAQSQKAYNVIRRIKREATISEVDPGKHADYYADAFGDSAYAKKMYDENPKGVGMGKGANTVEGRAAMRRKVAGIDVPFTKIAQEDDLNVEPSLLDKGINAGIDVVRDKVKAIVPAGLLDDQIDAIAENVKDFVGTSDFESKVQEEAAKVTASRLQMRKEARRQKLAQTYGEPVKEDYGDVGDPEWDGSKLDRNGIVGSPQDMIMSQLEKAIAKVREA